MSFRQFVSILLRQNRTRVAGSRKSGHRCPCQKQPCTKIATACFGRTISGRPGMSTTCSRNRYPRRCNPLRTMRSGIVFVLRIPDIIRRRTLIGTTSTIIAPSVRLRLWLDASRVVDLLHRPPGSTECLALVQTGFLAGKPRDVLRSREPRAQQQSCQIACRPECRSR
jgi:hypothetical protein